jgi:hypothetical protein
MWAMEVISGGQVVTASGATGIISSGADSFKTGSLTCCITGVSSGTVATGIAMANAGSNTIVPVAVEGIFILNSRGTTTAGKQVGAAGDDAVTDVGVAGTQIGRALSTAGSNTFAVIACRFY